jgi:hypothetical protein
MQTTSDEGHERADASASSGTCGVDEDTYKIELYGGGWSGAIGHAHEGQFAVPHTWKGIRWEHIRIPEFFLGHTAAMLVAQGMLLKDLFPPMSFFRIHAKEGDLVPSHGPYILLKGQLTKPDNPPSRLRDVVLAHVFEAPEGMKMEELQGLLLQQVL